MNKFSQHNIGWRFKVFNWCINRPALTLTLTMALVYVEIFSLKYFIFGTIGDIHTNTPSEKELWSRLSLPYVVLVFMLTIINVASVVYALITYKEFFTFYDKIKNVSFKHSSADATYADILKNGYPVITFSNIHKEKVEISDILCISHRLMIYKYKFIDGRLGSEDRLCVLTVDPIAKYLFRKILYFLLKKNNSLYIPLFYEKLK